jgi:hypothetical protein
MTVFRGLQDAKEIAALKLMRTCLPLFFAVFCCVTLAHAQRLGQVYFGLGTATDSSSGQSINTFGTGTLYPTPKMGGVFGNVGGSFLVTPHFGVGANVAWRFKQDDYAGLNYRPLFYDFNGIWEPSHGSTRVLPEFQGGIGGANLRFYYSQQFCNAFAGCSTSNSYLQSSNHFQVHVGAGVRFYVTPHIFIRPQFDYHWVNNFFQFGSNSVPQFGASVGYSFGEP